MPAELAHFTPAQRVHRWSAVLGPADVSDRRHRRASLAIVEIGSDRQTDRRRQLPLLRPLAEQAAQERNTQIGTDTV